MSSTSLDTVAVIDATLSGFLINIKVAKIIIEIHRTSAQVTTEQGSVCSKYSCYVYFTFLDQWYCYTS